MNLDERLEKARRDYQRHGQHPITDPAGHALGVKDDGGRPRRALLAVACIAALVVVASAALLVSRDDHRAEVRTDPGPTESPESIESPGVVPTEGYQAFPVPEHISRISEAVVWTGTDLVIWGGELDDGTTTARGARLDPISGAWTDLPAAPLEPNGTPTAVWSGSEVIVCCDHLSDVGGGAAYNPVTNAWREISAAPLAGADYPSSVWTGTEMVVVDGAREDAPESSVVAYDPSDDTWRELPALPFAADPNPDLAWDGQRVLLWAGGGFTARPLMVLDPDGGEWEEIPLPDQLRPHEGGTMAHTSEGTLVWGSLTSSDDQITAVWLPTGSSTWEQIRTPELPPPLVDEGTPQSFSSTAIGTSIAIWTANNASNPPTPVLTFDTTTLTWTSQLDVPFGQWDPTMVSAGNAYFVLAAGEAVLIDPNAGQIETPPITFPTAAPRECSTSYGPRPVVYLFNGSQSQRACYLVAADRPLTVQNKGDQPVTLEGPNGPITIAVDGRTDLVALGRWLGTGRQTIRSTPFGDLTLDIVPATASLSADMTFDASAVGPFKLGFAESDLVTSSGLPLGLLADAHPDDRCAPATVVGDPYSPLLHFTGGQGEPRVLRAIVVTSPTQAGPNGITVGMTSAEVYERTGEAWSSTSSPLADGPTRTAVVWHSSEDHQIVAILDSDRVEQFIVTDASPTELTCG